MSADNQWNLPPELMELKEKVEAEDAAKRDRAQRKAAGNAS
jgi:hypothetical protein